MLRSELKESKYAGQEYPDEYLLNVIGVMRERVSFIKEIFEKGSYFFEEPITYEEAGVKKRWNVQSSEILKQYAGKIELITSPSKGDYENALKDTAAHFNKGNGDVIHPLRLAVSGVSGGPGIFDILYIIGKEKTLSRIKTIIEKLN
jgi:glutamyl-tRNA synthetase